MIAYPFPAVAVLLVTDGGGALILVAAERARDFPQKPVYLPRHRRECRDADGQPCPSFPRQRESRATRVSTVPLDPAFAGVTKETRSSRAFRPKAFAEAGITHNDVDHLMIYDAPCSLPGASFAHLPIYGLEDLGFVPRGEAGGFIAERNTAPAQTAAQHQWRRSLLHAFRHLRHVRLPESVRQMHGIASPTSPAPKSRSATASAACSPPPARSSSRTSRLRAAGCKRNLPCWPFPLNTALSFL